MIPLACWGQSGKYSFLYNMMEQHEGVEYMTKTLKNLPWPSKDHSSCTTENCSYMDIQTQTVWSSAEPILFYMYIY